jgi:hypothetical protein
VKEMCSPPTSAERGRLQRKVRVFKQDGDFPKELGKVVALAFFAKDRGSSEPANVPFDPHERSRYLLVYLYSRSENAKDRKGLL